MNSTMENLVINMTGGAPVVDKLLFSWFDHCLFAIMLAMSALIGVYFGFCSKKQDNVAEYILGGKEMTTFPIAMSLVASHLSGLIVLGVPADIYIYGASYWLCTITMAITGILTVYVYLPVFYKLQLTSGYEYLKHRFDNSVRLLASILYFISTTLYLPIVIYIPALAFSQVTDVSIYYIAPLVCIVCIFYTTLGGLKAVVWTDTLQFSIMVVAMLVVLFLGFFATGTVSEVFQKAYDGGRLDLWNFDFDPTNRTSFWSVVVGFAASSTAYVAVSQSYVQKFLSLPSISNAKTSIVIFVIGIFLVKSISCIIALIMFAKYSDCDPIATGEVTKADQLMPYFVMDVAGKIPGLPGLFIAGVFCAALSTMSAGLNTLTGVVYEDFIKPFMPENTTEKRASDIMKLFVVLMGTFATSMVFIVDQMGSVLPLSISFGGVTSGPLLGMFSLGMLVPFANTKGALTGALTALCLVSWIMFGAQYHIAQGAVFTEKLPTNTEGCDFFVNATVAVVKKHYTPYMYRMSFYFYGFIGTAITLVVGSIISLLTGGGNQKIDRDLLSPVIYFLLPEDQRYDYKTVEHAKNYAVDKEENDKR